MKSLPSPADGRGHANAVLVGQSLLLTLLPPSTKALPLPASGRAWNTRGLRGPFRASYRPISLPRFTHLFVDYSVLCCRRREKPALSFVPSLLWFQGYFLPSTRDIKHFESPVIAIFF